MTWDEYNKEFNNVIKDSFRGIGETMVILGTQALTTIKKRVQETGINAEGEKFEPYSNKPMLSGCSNFLDKSKCEKYIGSKTKRRKERNKNDYEKYLSGESGEFELRWVTLKRGGKNVRLFEIPGGYKEFREINLGRDKTEHVDFFFSGRMWANIGIISNYNEHDKGVVIIGAKEEENKKKLEGNTKHRGDILDLSQKEIDELTRQLGLKALNVFKEHNLA